MRPLVASYAVIARCLLGGLVLAGAMAGCVGEPERVLPPGWFQLEPGVGRTIDIEVIDEAGVAKTVAALEIAPESISQATAIRLTVPATTEPVFFQAGMQLRTAVIQVEPADFVFGAPARLILPWFPFSETVETEDVRAWSSVGLAGIPRGLWEAETPEPALPDRVVVPIQWGGHYWAGTWEQDPSRTPEQVEGDACLQADDSGLEDCSFDRECVVRGCLGEICSLDGTRSTVCLPRPITIARFGCACRCSPGICQWVQ